MEVDTRGFDLCFRVFEHFAGPEAHPVHSSLSRLPSFTQRREYISFRDVGW